MRFVILCLFCFLLFSGSVIALALADYPDMFFEGDKFGAVIITSSEREYAETIAVNYLLNTLTNHYRVPRRTRYGRYAARTTQELPKVVRDVEVKNIFRTDAVVIGTPCSNSKVRELLRVPVQQCGEAFSFFEGGLLKLIEHPSGAKQLVITGTSPRFVLHAARFLVTARYRRQLASKTVPVRVVSVLYRPQGFLGVEGYPYRDVRMTRYGTTAYTKPGRGRRIYSITY